MSLGHVNEKLSFECNIIVTIKCLLNIFELMCVTVTRQANFIFI